MSKYKESLKQLAQNFNGKLSEVEVNLKDNGSRLSFNTRKVIDENNPSMPDIIRWHRQFNPENYEYVVNVHSLEIEALSNLESKLKSIAQECSPAKMPKRTKYWKTITHLLRRMRQNGEFNELVDHAYDIGQYYDHVTKTDSIKSSANDVHRKNIHNLLILMEKKYGATKKNSN